MAEAADSPGQNPHRARRSLRDTTKRFFSDAVTPSVLGGIIPLSGVQELASAGKQLIQSLKDSEHDPTRYLALTRKIRYLATVVKDMAEVDPEWALGPETELRDIKTKLDKASEQRSSRFQSAEQNETIWEGLEEHIKDLAEFIKMKQNGMTAVQDFRSSQYDIIKPHELTGQEEIKALKATRSSTKSAAPEVTKSYRRARLGGLSVVYITYSSENPIEAEKLVRQQADLHSRHLHINIATVRGVTRGERLNGVVLASASLPFEEFVRRVRCTSVLAQCLKQLRNLEIYHSSLGGIFSDTNVELLSVDLDGCVKATLTKGKGYNSSFWVKIFLNVTDLRNMDPTFATILNVFNANQSSKATSEFLDLISLAKGGLTELKVLHLAHMAGVPPKTGLWHSMGSSPPKLPMYAGQSSTYWPEFGESAGMSGKGLVTMLKLRFRNHLPGNDGSTKASRRDAHVTFVTVLNKEDRLNWKSQIPKWTRRAKALSTTDQENSIFLTTSVMCHVIISRPEHTLGSRPLYYHRNDAAVSDPKSFWGYFSTDSDPLNWAKDAKFDGWTYEYFVYVSFYDIRDDWGYKYKQLLRQSMSCTPGAFPGTEEDQSSDEE